MPSIAIGGSVALTIPDGGSVAVSSNYGFFTSTLTPTVGDQSVRSWGPEPIRRVFVPFKLGGTLVIASQNAEVMYDQYIAGSSASSSGTSGLSQAKLYQATMEPFTTSTDSWVTVANQTPAAFNADRQTLNTGYRTTLYTNLDGFLEIDTMLSSGVNSGRFQVSFGAFTGDGIHVNYAGNTFPPLLAAIRSGLGLS